MGRFSNRISELAKDAGKTQADLVRATGIDQSTMSDLWNGKKELKRSRDQSIAVALGCSFGALTDSPHTIDLVPVVLAVTASQSEGRPDCFDLPAPHEREPLPNRLRGGAADLFAARVYDGSAGSDYPPGSLLFIRPLAALARPLRAGEPIVVRRYHAPIGTGPGRPETFEVLYGLLEVTRIGDLILETNPENTTPAQNPPIQRGESRLRGLAERVLRFVPRADEINYRPRPDDQAEIIGIVEGGFRAPAR